MARQKESGKDKQTNFGHRSRGLDNGLVEKNRLFLYHLWNRTALFYPQIMTKPKRKKIWDFIFLFRTTPPFTMAESDSFSKVVLRGVMVRKRKIASQIFFLLGLVIICG